MSSMIYFNKVRDVKSPTQAYNYPAGTDFYVPNYNQKFKHDLIERNHNTDEYNLFAKPDSDVMTITVMPHGQINIPSGIRVEITNKDSCLLAVNKSGIATKLRLDVAAALVDADYHGEITLSLTNTSDHPVSFNTGDKLLQFVNLPVIYPIFAEVLNEDYDKLVVPSDRGDKGFGSSDK